MSVTILGPKHTPFRRNQYLLSVEYEHGGADFSEIQQFVFVTSEELEMVVKFLRECKDNYIRNRDAASVCGLYNDLFDQYMCPDQIYTGSGEYAAIDHIDVTWYDENGVAFAVEVN